MSSPPYSKRDVLRFLLEQGQPVRILLDARRDSVVVPARFRASPQLILEIGYRMNPPIPDLELTDEGVTCTLSFAKQPHPCVLPWTAIWALIGKSDGRGYQWVEDMPPEMVAIPQPPPPPRMAPVLRALQPTREPDEAKESEAPAEEAPREEPEKPAEAPREEPAADGPAEAPAAAEEKAPEKPADEGADEGARPGGKKKRELPSYLRVIK